MGAEGHPRDQPQTPRRNKVKILAQYNRSLEDSEEEWVLVEMLGQEFIIFLERGDKDGLPLCDVEWFTLDEMKEYPKTLGLLMKNKNDRAISEEFK